MMPDPYFPFAITNQLRLGELYRIGAFISVALILIAASFVYQRFISGAGQKITPPA